MSTTLELPDPLFPRLKARAARERVTLKQLLQPFVEQGLNQAATPTASTRSAQQLRKLEGRLPSTRQPSAMPCCLSCKSRAPHDRRGVSPISSAPTKGWPR
jgi:hypothetical protein